ncbi:hypothetical protein SK128_015047, partial [Halocaridina rubra]
SNTGIDAVAGLPRVAENLQPQEATQAINSTSTAVRRSVRIAQRTFKNNGVNQSAIIKVK